MMVPLRQSVSEHLPPWPTKRLEREAKVGDVEAEPVGEARDAGTSRCSGRPDEAQGMLWRQHGRAEEEDQEGGAPEAANEQHPGGGLPHRAR